MRRGDGGGIVSVIAMASVLAVAAEPARGQAVSDSVTTPESTQAGVLFASDTPLRFRFVGDLKTLLNDRDSVTSTDHPFMLTYQVGDATPIQLEVELKTRGHWRRQERHCDFPPLRLNVPRSKVGGTLFAGQDKLKLVTPCRPSVRDYEEYVLREYAVYQVYNALTPLSLRARRATTTYVDTAGRMDSLTTHTFLMEDVEQMAVRVGGKLMEVQGARFTDVDSLQLGLMGVFLYMVGSTDWSLRGLHNVELVLGLQQGAFYPVAYDFDFTGIVNTAYARPDPRLRIPSVRFRLYRGGCFTQGHWDTVLATFRERKAALYAVYDSLPGLSERYVKDTRRYLDDFYKVIDDPGKVSKELVGRCWPEEGV